MKSIRSMTMRRRLLSGAALGAGLACCAQPAIAQDRTGQSQVQEVVVTAQHRTENIQSVPIAIQAFTGKALRDLGVKTSTDLGQFTPNVEIALPNGEGNQPIISIRGIGLNDYDTNNAGPNGVYMDEVYLSSPASQTFQTFDLDRVEVLKGPQGTLYGRNTSGGAINFVSAKPTDQPSGNLHIDYGSFNTLNVEGAAGGPIRPNLDGRVAFTVNESGGYMWNALTGDQENGANNIAARVELLYKPSDRLKILLNVHGGYLDNRPSEYRHIGDIDPVTSAQCSVARTNAGDCVDLFGYGTPKKFYDGSFNRTQHLRISNLGADVRADYAAGNVDLTSITALEYSDKLHPEDSDASPNRLLEIDYGVKTTTFTQELRASETRERFNWVAGAYYLYENLSQDQPLQALLDIDQVYGPGSGDGLALKTYDQSRQISQAGAVFGQTEIDLTSKLKLIVGGRYTTETKSFDYQGSVQYQDGGENNFGPIMTLANSRQSLSDSAFSWRAGLNYSLTPKVMAYLSVATGFKSGDFNGSFLSTNADEIARQLRPVAPETVTAYEIGVKSSFFDRRLILNAAAFYNDYKDMQVFVLVPPVAGGTGFPVDVLDNAPRAHTDGLDLQLTAKPASPLTATVQLGVLETRLDTYVSDRDPSQPDYSGNQLPLSPHLSASILLEYRGHAGPGDFSIQGSANYKGHAFFDISNSPYLDQAAYWIENVRVAYALSGQTWEIAAYVHNLSGEQYYVDKFDLTNPFGLIQGVVGQPRTVGVELNYRY
jgi:iron complex outermembrane receptor protein